MHEVRWLASPRQGGKTKNKKQKAKAKAKAKTKAKFYCLQAFSQ